MSTKKKRPVVVTFYVPDESFVHQIHEAAQREGLPPSVWIRETVMMRVEKLLKESPHRERQS
jgi:hypothetical protein